MAYRASATISIPVNTGIEIIVPTLIEEGLGQFAKTGSVFVNGEERDLLSGFVVENEDVGTIVPINNHPDGLAVKYIHKMNAQNRVFFYTSTNDKHIIDIITIPIHDHSSIYQGGPAFGTYASDYKETTEGG